MEDWLALHRRAGGETVWDTEVTARRALSFLAQSPLILHDADHDLYRDFVRSLLRHASVLRSAIGSSEPGLPRMHAAIAIALIGLSLSQQERLARAGLDRVDAELQAQILPDGGHVSRNPSALVEILVDLLPLRQALIARGLVPSETLMNSIDRMMPMLRFFRHGDGAFAHFNGVAASASGLVATVISYDETLGTPGPERHLFRLRAHRGRRFRCSSSIPAAPPPIAYSSEAHAGTLSFEFSRGTQRIVINCGAPAARHQHLRRAARRTAAHSTAVLNEEFVEPLLQPRRRRADHFRSALRHGPAAQLRTTAPPSCRRAMTAMSAASGWCTSGTFASRPTAGCSKAWTASSAAGRGDLQFAVRFHLHHAVARPARPTGAPRSTCACPTATSGGSRRTGRSRSRRACTSPTFSAAARPTRSCSPATPARKFR